MTTLIVGASGFIGRRLVEHFHGKGQRVIAYDLSDEYGSLGALDFPRIKAGVKYIEQFLPDLKGVTKVVYLASSMNSMNMLMLDEECFFEDLLNARAIARFCLDAKIKKFVFASSGGTIYGDAGAPPYSEFSPNLPLSIYGIGKLTLEKYFLATLKRDGVSVVNLRIANPYGVGQKTFGSQGVITIFIDRIMRGNEIILRNPDAVRDYLYIDDLCFAIDKSLNYSGDLSTFNIGSGIPVSLMTVVRTIESIVDRPAIISLAGEALTDVKANYLNVNLAKLHLGWAPTTGLQSGVRKTYEWLQSEGYT